MSMQDLYRCKAYFDTTNFPSLPENTTTQSMAGSLEHAQTCLKWFETLPGFTGGHIEECVRDDDHPWWVVWNPPVDEDDDEPLLDISLINNNLVP